MVSVVMVGAVERAGRGMWIWIWGSDGEGGGEERGDVDIGGGGGGEISVSGVEGGVGDRSAGLTLFG